MTSEINKLKHFHIEDYSGINFTDDLNLLDMVMEKVVQMIGYINK